MMLRLLFLASMCALCVSSVADLMAAVRTMPFDDFDAYLTANTDALMGTSLADVYDLAKAAVSQNDVRYVLCVIKWPPAKCRLTFDTPAYFMTTLARHVFNRLMKDRSFQSTGFDYADMPSPWNHFVHSILINENRTETYFDMHEYESHLAIALGMEHTAVHEGRTPLADLSLASRVLATSTRYHKFPATCRDAYTIRLLRLDEDAARAIAIGLADYDLTTLQALEQMSAPRLEEFAAKFYAILRPVTEVDATTFGMMTRWLIDKVAEKCFVGNFEQLAVTTASQLDS